jgi:hypothetical protein
VLNEGMIEDVYHFSCLPLYIVTCNPQAEDVERSAINSRTDKPNLLYKISISFAIAKQKLANA